MKIVTLNISTFRGWSMDAEHWYAKMYYVPPFQRVWSTSDSDRRHFEITRAMTKKEAELLTEKDGWLWNEGEITTRFDSIELIDEAAIPIFEANFDPDEDLLVRCHDAHSSRWEKDRYRKVLAGKPVIFKQFEGLDLEEAAKVAEELGILSIMRGY